MINCQLAARNQWHNHLWRGSGWKKRVVKQCLESGGSLCAHFHHRSCAKLKIEKAAALPEIGGFRLWIFNIFLPPPPHPTVQLHSCISTFNTVTHCCRHAKWVYWTWSLFSYLFWLFISYSINNTFEFKTKFVFIKHLVIHSNYSRTSQLENFEF